MKTIEIPEDATYLVVSEKDGKIKAHGSTGEAHLLTFVSVVGKFCAMSLKDDAPIDTIRATMIMKLVAGFDEGLKGENDELQD